MHEILGEVVSLRGETWRVPMTGVPVPVDADDGVAFAIAAHGGRRHRMRVPSGTSLESTQHVVDDYLARVHRDAQQVVCAIEMHGRFTDVVLRTVAPPQHDGETLGEIIDDEVRFSFSTWTGTMVGFRFPDSSKGETIPGLHLHGIADDRRSGGHLRSMIVDNVTTHLWIDELHPVRTVAPTAIPSTPTPLTSAATKAPPPTPPTSRSSIRAPIKAVEPFPGQQNVFDKGKRLRICGRQNVAL